MADATYSEEVEVWAVVVAEGEEQESSMAQEAKEDS